MLEGIEIMLKRMETHPEEFVANSRYHSAVMSVLSSLTDEEISALKEGLRIAHRKVFNGEIMRVMSGDDKADALDEYRLKTASILTSMVSKHEKSPTISDLVSTKSAAVTATQS